jgi:hypothetical protein
MLIAQVLNQSITIYPLTILQVRTMYPHVSWPDEPNSAALDTFFLVTVYPTDPPTVGKNQVLQEDMPTFNQTTSRWEQNWSVIANSLSMAVAAEKQLVAETRYAIEVSGTTFNYREEGSIQVATDRESQIKLFATYAMARDGYWVDGSTWKFADGVFRELTAQEAIAVALTVAGYVKVCFAREDELVTQINSATTIEEASDWVW